MTIVEAILITSGAIVGAAIVAGGIAWQHYRGTDEGEEMGIR